VSASSAPAHPAHAPERIKNMPTAYHALAAPPEPSDN
jgi:hypothetical protein